MRTSVKLIFGLAFICFVAQASVLETLLNNTKFRGKAVLNTTKGLNLSYDGGVSFNLKGHEIKLVDLGVNLKASPQFQSSSDNTTTTVIKYSGSITLTEGTNTSSTDVTISGTTTVVSAVNSTYDNKTQTTYANVSQIVNDSNSFNIRSGLSLISGRSSEGLSTVSAVAQAGNNIKISQNTGLYVDLKGSAYDNGTSLGAFSATSVTTTSTNETATLQNCPWLPNVTLSGSSSFGNQNSLFFNETSYNTSKNGSVGFVGFTNVKIGNASTGVSALEGVNYNYASSYTVNNTVLNASSVYGIGKVNTAYEVNTTSNGSSTGYFLSGKIYQVSQDSNAASQTKRSKSRLGHRYTEVTEDSFTSEESAEFLANYAALNQPKRLNRATPNSQYYSTLSAGWKAGVLSTTLDETNTTAVTNTTIGASYSVAGINTKDFKPYSVSGNESITTSFKTSISGQNVKAVDNITVSSNKNPSFENKMQKLEIPQVDNKSLKYPNKPRL